MSSLRTVGPGRTGGAGALGAILAVVCCLPMLASAKPEIVLERESVFLGEPMTVTVITRGASSDQPELFVPEGLTRRFVDKQARQLTDGAAGLAWRFLVIAMRAGELQLQVPYGDPNGEEIFYVTKELTAKEPKSTDQMGLTAGLDVERVYLGQPVILSVSWELSLPVQNVRAVDLRVPLLESPDFKVIAPFDESRGGSQTIGVPVSGSRVIADRRSVRRDQGRATGIVFKRILVPQKAGSYAIDPATLLCSIHEGAASRFQYPSYFNNDFFLSDEGAKHVRVWAKSAPLKLMVEPLPSDPPADFTGIVGTCVLELDAAVKEVDAGEPVLVRIRATEYPVMEAFELPMLGELPAYANRFDCPASYVSGDVADGAKTFERIIRPQRPEVSEIPAVRFSVFDPDTGSYVKVTSNTLPLKVNPARTFTAFDADFADGRTLKNQVQTSEQGISHNVFGGAVLAREAPVASRAWMPWVWLVLWLPPLVFLLALVRHSPWFAEFANPRRRAAKRALARVEALSGSGDPVALAAAVREFVAARYGLLPQAHGFADLAARCGLSAEELQPLADLYAVAADRRYGTGSEGVVDAGAVVTVVRRLARQPWPARSRLVAGNGLALLLVAAVLLPGSSEAATATETLAAAEATFNAALAAAMEDSAEGRELYRQAALHYERLIADHGARNADVYLNLGNAWYLADEPGLAIANYLRGERFDPDNPLIQQNLAHVRGEVSDEFPLSGWQSFGRRVQGGSALLPAWLRLVLLAICYGACWRLLWLARSGRRRHPRAIIGLAAMTAVLLVSLSVGNDASERGVIVVKEVMPRKGNAFVYDGAFTTALHAGTEFAVIEQREDWFHAEFSNGDRAWLPSPAVQLVARP